MTPQEILELSEEVEAIYTDVQTQLIVNICKRLGEGKELPGWQAKKLAELNALTQESIEIIARATGRRDEEIEKAIAKALKDELKEVEPILSGAVAAGAIADIIFSPSESEGLKQLLQALADQAKERTNLVNTVMLNSTRNRYIWAINNTEQEKARIEAKWIEKNLNAQNLDELDKQLSKVQKALNKATSMVESGAEAREQALSRTVKELSQEGITGFIDKGGHHWSPEAYINMDIRTTVHNAALQAAWTRMEEYGVSVYQVSSHAGARPLCAP